MRIIRMTWFLAAILVGPFGLVGVPSAQAQMRSLGGYGASSIGSYYGRGNGPLIPYAGGQGGFIPYEGLQRRAPADVVMRLRQVPQTSIGGASMSATPIGGASLRKGPGIYQPFKYRGRFGTGGGSNRPRKYGPGFMSPFRRPPSLAGGGM
jgi:hypothetical protein